MPRCAMVAGEWLRETKAAEEHAASVGVVPTEWPRVAEHPAGYRERKPNTRDPVRIRGGAPSINPPETDKKVSIAMTTWPTTTENRIEPLPMFLTPADLSRLTGRVKSGAQCRWLKEHGWPYERDAKGRPVVLRSVVEARMGGDGLAEVEPEPEWEAM